jgi:hypothetical protein
VNVFYTWERKNVQVLGTNFQENEINLEACYTCERSDLPVTIPFQSQGERDLINLKNNVFISIFRIFFFLLASLATIQFSRCHYKPINEFAYFFLAIILITNKNVLRKITEHNGAAKSTAAPGGKRPRYATA